MNIERLLQVLSDAKRHESVSAFVPVTELESLLAEVERLESEIRDLREINEELRMNL